MTLESPTPPDQDAHKAKMARIKAARDRLMATKTETRGLMIVHTGKGKGKSSAAFGMVMRCLGHGLRVGIVQFIKGAWTTGEARFLARFPELVDIKTMGEGFTWETQDRTRDVAAATRAWAAAEAMLADPAYRMVVLDEINYCCGYHWISGQEIAEFIEQHRPSWMHLILTGRNAAPEVIATADTVTEMTLIKHAYQQGIKAEQGIEF